MDALKVFNNAQLARDYRHENGTGGWIFADDAGEIAVLFPPDYYPSRIFCHPLTRGMSGSLLGAQ